MTSTMTPIDPENMLTLHVNPSDKTALGLASYGFYKFGQGFTVANEPSELLAGFALTTSDGSNIVGHRQAFEHLEGIGDTASISSLDNTFVEAAISNPGGADFAMLKALMDSLDDHLMLRTFVSSHTPSASDFILWGTLAATHRTRAIFKAGEHVHLSRWFSHMEALPSTRTATEALRSLATSVKPSVNAANPYRLDGPTPPDKPRLPGTLAVDGHVVTRFPPEPSGYLHIGHLKAALLNREFAAAWNGRFLLRMDDTNPGKSTVEFEKAILEDLAGLGFTWHQMTHTSDYFDLLHEKAVDMIKLGHAFVDDSPKEEMRESRDYLKGLKPSKCRDRSIEENLSLFSAMTSGEITGDSLVLRAKIDYKNANGALRDPTLFRCFSQPHPTTGTKYSTYPTYDFACPIVDSIEGVTHAFRTDEYKDRNEQYHWIIKVLGLRDPYVWEFSRLSFVHTLLSKRMLRECLELGVADGWADPRFPTIRGLRRRGMTAETMVQYLLSVGPSQNQMWLEWDGIWSLNKRIVDPIVPRYTALDMDKIVSANISGDYDPQGKDIPRHKKNPTLGMRPLRYGGVILLEKSDVDNLKVGDEITLMDWGNATIANILPGSIDLTLLLQGDFKNTKKLTWLALPPNETDPKDKLTKIELIEYGHLITKAKPKGKDPNKDEVADIANFNGIKRVSALADPDVRPLAEGSMVQFQRKGYYRLDGVNAEGMLQFISIPDGRMH